MVSFSYYGHISGHISGNIATQLQNLLLLYNHRTVES